MPVGNINRKKSVLANVSRVVKVIVSVVEELTYSGKVLGTMDTERICGWRPVIKDTHESISYPSGDKDVIVRVSGGVVVGGENSPFIWNEKGRVIFAELRVATVNKTTVVETVPTQDPVWSCPLSTVHVEEAIGKGWIVDKSSFHCKFDGNWTLISPSTRTGLLGVRLITIAAVVLTKAGEKLIEHAANCAFVSVTVVDYADTSEPILMINGSVVSAG